MMLLVANAASARLSVCDEAGWKITFEDDFEGTSLDPASWVAVDNVTHGNTEKQLYLRDNVHVVNGSLVLRTRKQEAWHKGRPYNYTSGWVESKGLRFQAHGRFEVRAKLPSAASGHDGDWPILWPAHWLMPEPSRSVPPNVCWPVGGEIDIMEAFHPRGHRSDPDWTSVYLTYHWAKECNVDEWDRKSGKWPPLDDNTTRISWGEWHSFAVEWSQQEIVWMIDGTPRYRRVAGQPSSLFIPQDPFYMILNTAVQHWADAPRDRGLPADHLIDRVRFCQRRGV